MTVPPYQPPAGEDDVRTATEGGQTSYDADRAVADGEDVDTEYQPEQSSIAADEAAAESDRDADTED